jgi:endonuclease/exonuclease/phosphatase family metal-dependent hydrolase
MRSHQKAAPCVAPLLFSLLAQLSLAGDLFPPAGPEETRIVSYNVENYTTMPRIVNGHPVAAAGKPESERDAVVQSIAMLNPDIIGLMEVGSPEEFQDLRRRLRKAGLDYPVAEYLNGPDQARHLALLSRYPVVERHSQEDIPLRVGTVTLHSPRGFLDVTVEPIAGHRIRLLCVHLKAKLEVTDYDATSLREAEATFLRKRVREILSRDKDSLLVVMGDFNDTKNSRTIREITGKPDWTDSLNALPLTDGRGENWTEHWEGADVYSRIDYMMVSKKLELETDADRSGVARFPFWRKASDHCPLVLTLTNSRHQSTSSIPAPARP